MRRNDINKIENLSKLINNLRHISINCEYLLKNLYETNDCFNNNIISGRSIDNEIILRSIKDCNKIMDNVFNIERQCKNRINRLNSIKNGEYYG